MSGRGGVTGRQLNRLTLDLMLRVTDYVRANYASSGLSETEFAELASQALGFPVGAANINTARSACGLPANAKVKSAAIRAEKAAKVAAAKPEGLHLVLDELHALNKQVANLTAAINTLLKAAGQR